MAKGFKQTKKGQKIETVRKAIYLNLCTGQKEALTFDNEPFCWEKAPGVTCKEVIKATYVDNWMETGIRPADKPEFQKMIKDAMDGKIDMIETEDIHMFAGNTEEALHYCRLLKEKGIEVLFNKMGCGQGCSSLCGGFEAEVREKACPKRISHNPREDEEKPKDIIRMRVNVQSGVDKKKLVEILGSETFKEAVRIEINSLHLQDAHELTDEVMNRAVYTALDKLTKK